MAKMRAKFYLYGNNIPFVEIANKLGVEPSKVMKKEEWPNPSIDAGLAQDVWAYYTEKEECRAISDQLDKLAIVLSSKTCQVQELLKSYNLSSSITIVIELDGDDKPEIVLTRENVQLLSRLNAELGFDMYFD